jgi:hypothetical protein
MWETHAVTRLGRLSLIGSSTTDGLGRRDRRRLSAVLELAVRKVKLRIPAAAASLWELPRETVGLRHGVVSEHRPHEGGTGPTSHCGFARE